MKIFVTGATGFLGRFLVPKLHELGHDVVGIHSKSCDLTQPRSLDQFKNTSFDQIYHLAAWTQAGDFCLRHPGEQWIINQQINTNILHFWHRSQPQAKLICMGTSCSYAPENKLSEENYLEGNPIESLYTYAMTKRMLLIGLQSLHNQFGLRYLYLIPSTLYGPNYHKDGRQMHFIFDLIRKIVAKKEKNETVILWGDGEQKRELIHVHDFIKALLFLTEETQNTHINIGGGSEHTIKEFAGLICREIGVDESEIVYDRTKYVGARSKILSIEKLRTIMPHFMPRSLQEGLGETIASYCSNS